MGLQASEMLTDSNSMVAGPWHPAFGHLVLSRILFDKALAILTSWFGENGALQVTLRVHPRVESQLRGMGNANIHKLKECFQLKELIVQTDTLVPEESVLISEVGDQMPEVGGQGSEVSGRRSKARSQRPEVRN